MRIFEFEIKKLFLKQYALLIFALVIIIRGNL